jgi:hypothetical protein
VGVIYVEARWFFTSGDQNLCFRGLSAEFLFIISVDNETVFVMMVRHMERKLIILYLIRNFDSHFVEVKYMAGHRGGGEGAWGKGTSARSRGGGGQNVIFSDPIYLL